MEDFNTGEFTTFDTAEINKLKAADDSPDEIISEEKKETKDKETEIKTVDEIFETGTEAKANEEILKGEESIVKPAYLESDDEVKSIKEVTADSTDLRTLFETAVEIGTIKVPDDFEFDGSEEAFDIAIKLDRQYRESDAESALYSKIQDPMLREAIQYGIQGAGFSDFVGYLQSMNDEQDFKNFDISNEDSQKELLMHFYMEKGLDKDLASRSIEASIIDDKLEEDAKKALTHYENVIPRAREQERVEASRLANERKEQRDAYERAFNETLRNSSYSQQKKNEVRGALSPVQLGQSRLPMWQAKILEIQNSPDHYIEFLDMLNSYDKEAGFSDERIKNKVKTQTAKTIYDKFRKAGDKKTTSSERSHSKGLRTPLRNPAFGNITRN